MSDYSLTLDTKDLEKFQEVVAKAPAKTIELVKNAVYASANSIRTDAKSFAPHKTGALQDSIHVEGPTATPGNISASVGTDLKYAPYQEYGTGVYSEYPGASHEPIVITAKNKKALFWPGASHPVKSVTIQGIKPKLYMKQAFEKGQEKFTNNIKDALDKVVSFLAEG